MLKSMAMAACAGLVALSAVSANAEPPHEKLQKYTSTGEKENCIEARKIKESRVLDSQNILFRLEGRDYYLNKLPQRCGGLGFNRGFSYDLSGSRTLCAADPIHTEVSVCMLGQFEKLEKAS